MTIAVLAVTASLAGLLSENLYRDNRLVTLSWVGNDLVTLALAIPILIVSWLYSMHGSQRATLVWIGMLDYMLYNFTFHFRRAASPNSNHNRALHQYCFRPRSVAGCALSFLGRRLAVENPPMGIQYSDNC